MTIDSEMTADAIDKYHYRIDGLASRMRANAFRIADFGLQRDHSMAADELDRLAKAYDAERACNTPLLDMLTAYNEAVEFMLTHFDCGGPEWWKGWDMLKAAHAKATERS